MSDDRLLQGSLPDSAVSADAGRQRQPQERERQHSASRLCGERLPRHPETADPAGREDGRRLLR